MGTQGTALIPSASASQGGFCLSNQLLARLAEPLVIGELTLHSRVMQSPLAGVTDLPFRQLVRQYAPCSLLYTEMVHARGLAEARRYPRIAEITPSEHPIGLQLFDRHPQLMAEAARKAEGAGAQVIDINMGCPVKKITGKGGGSSLLREPELAEDIVKAVATAVAVPVTVKTRLGWCEESIEIVEFAQRLQAAGAQLLTLHARTRAQGFGGKARWQWIKQVKQALEIPIIANGDIDSVAAAIDCLQVSEADGVMCARGSLGAPELVGQIDRYLKTGHYPEPLSPIQRLQIARAHFHRLWIYKGQQGILQGRKHAIWYLERLPSGKVWRDRLCRMKSIAEADDILDRAIDAYTNELVSLETG